MKIYLWRGPDSASDLETLPTTAIGDTELLGLQPLTATAVRARNDCNSASTASKSTAREAGVGDSEG